MHVPSNRFFARTAVALALGLAVGFASAQAPAARAAGQDTVPVQSAGKIPPVTGSREKPVPSWGKPLPYPVVIADRRNNRLLEVAPDKRVIWRFGSPNLKIYHDNDDVYFRARRPLGWRSARRTTRTSTSSTTTMGRWRGATASPTSPATARAR
jgi:hypothetical protein